MRHRRGCGGGLEIQVPHLASELLSYDRQEPRRRIVYTLLPEVHGLVGYAKLLRQGAQSEPLALA
jgi:hypothetical protein